MLDGSEAHPTLSTPWIATSEDLLAMTIRKAWFFG
jgi:hypothetical protein